VKFGPLTPSRRSDPELMDAPGLATEEVAGAYRALRRVNWQLGNSWALGRELRRYLAEERPGRVRVLDVGSGSGDLLAEMLTRLGRQAVEATGVALDRDPTAALLARDSGAIVVRADALRLPFGDGSFELATAVKFAHHFEGRALATLVSELARVATRRVVVLDIRRHWAAYWGFVAWSHLFTRNRLVRHDGPLSVLRGFTAAELRDLGERVGRMEWTVRRYPGFQLAMVGRRSAGAQTLGGRRA